MTLHAACAAPQVSPLRFVSAQNVPRYARLELACNIGTQAKNVFLPFDANAPTYAANLKPDEDAREGVSADLLLLPPGQTLWERARTQPAFYFQPFAPAEPALPQHPTDLLLPAGKPEWRVRFSPDIVGQWHCKLRVVDRTGTVFGPVLAFTCTPSHNAGFVRVSPTDSRYLIKDNGNVCAFIGDNYQHRDDVYHDFAKFAVEHNAGGAECLLRVWIGARNGLEVFGGFANSDGGRTWGFGSGDNACVLNGKDGHTGRFCVHIPPHGELTTSIPVRSNLPYTVSAWVKTVNNLGGTLHLAARVPGANETRADFAVTGQWARITHSLAPVNAPGASFLNIAFRADTAVLIDDIAVTGPDGNDNVCAGDFERHVRPNQRQAWLLDNIVEVAARNSQSLRLVCFDNDDSVYCNVGADGTASAHDDANFYGRTNDPRVDLPVRRWQSYAVRYLVARYGYSPAVAQWEFCNEGPSYNGNCYAASEAFGRNIHSFAAQGKRMAGTSFYQNNSAPSYVPEFYESSQYPDMDYADAHYYPATSSNTGSFIPFNNDVNFFAVRGFSLDPHNGPNGWGRLWATAQSILPWRGTDPNFAAQQFPVFRVRGKGVWHLSGWFKQSADARFVGSGPVLKLAVSGVGECVAGPKAPTPAFAKPHATPPASGGTREAGRWVSYSAPFTVPDNADYIGATLRYEATGLKQGQVEFSGLQLTGPDGRDRVAIHFNEPRMDTDTAALAQYLPLDYTGVSGDPEIGKPLSIGETDYLASSVYNPQLAQDVQGVWLRHFVWAHLNPSGAIVFWWYSPTLNKAGERGFWNFAAAYQRFLQDVPLANGRYRNIDARCDNSALQIIGQADITGAQAHFFVYNRELNWHAQAVLKKRPVPSTHIVTVRGLPNGLYQIQTWDTARGIPVQVQSVRARNKLLSVPVRLPTGEAAVKLRKFAP